MARPKNNNQLSIGRVQKPVPPEKVAYKLPPPLIANLALYREAYKAMYNEEIDEDTLVALIFENHLAKDRAFNTWLKAQSKTLAR
jgi:hypothetical protein